MTATSSQFADFLDARFRDYWNSGYTELPDMTSTFYRVLDGKFQTDRFSSVGALGELQAFTGTVQYDDLSQGYDTSVTPLEFALGFAIERRLKDDMLFDIMDGRAQGLAHSAYYTRQTHAARPFNNAFSVDTFFYTNTEGVSMCSDSHTSTSTATSTATGFDNRITSSLNAVTFASARTQLVNLRNDRGQLINLMPDMIIVPDQGSMLESAWEIVNSQGKPDVANNNANMYYKNYQVVPWKFLTDANNWFLADSKVMKQNGLIWIDKVKPEFAFVESFDEIIGKWRCYGRWASGHRDWRFIVGAEVS